MRVLFAGDVVGEPGRCALVRVAARLKAEGRADCVVANAENAAGGNGLTAPLAQQLHEAGVDFLTLGDHAWGQRELAPRLASLPWVVRPANFAPGCPGQGVATQTIAGISVSVINLIGRVFMAPADCPFRTADALLAQRAALGAVILVDIHAEATSEKICLGRYLDGRVAAVLGSHTHVQTADERILPKGTAYLTDLGMTGPQDGVLGRELGSVTQRFLSGMPTKFGVARDRNEFQGALVTVDALTGAARAIERLREPIP
ncbi:MAG: YmdB family metallophosphoesterase [Candidatus Marinimicrobia bacterium]|nr:YmdB family metallophosphoesterase [Candidatus Neomarinimicrobiota bacterium]